MSGYSDYLKKLNFGTTSDSINAMKDRQISKLSNPLEQKYEGLQAQMGNLTSGMANISSSDQPAKTVENIISGIGTGTETLSSALGMKKLLGKVTNRLNEKDESDMSENAGEAGEPSESSGTSGTSGTSETFSAPEEAPEVPEAPEPTVTETPLAPRTVDIPDTELGSTQTTTEPSGSGGGDIEMQTFNSNVEPEEDSGFDGTGLGDVGEATGEATSDAAAEAAAAAAAAAAGKVGGVAGEAAGAAGEVAGDAAAAAASGVAEVVGAGLESIPVVGQILGTLLMAGGAIFGALSSSSENASTESDEKQMGEDQTAEANLKLQELKNQATVGKEQFTGSNVMESLSSTANQAVTSTSF